jgi:hypothetical protein
VANFDKSVDFDNAYSPAELGALKTIILLAALLAYAAGFAILYPIVASSVAKSVSEGNDPGLIQSVSP